MKPDGADVPVIESPCTGICAIDPAGGWCRGCGRTLDEIARWGSTDDADRAAVMATLPGRLGQGQGRRAGKVD